MIKTKDQLKQLFSNGSLPNGDSFANLIDSMAQERDLSGLNTKMTQGQTAQSRIEQALADVKTHQRQLQQKLEAELAGKQATPEPGLSTQDWIGAGGRFGRFDDSAAIPSASSFATLSVNADGNWHPVISSVTGCCAFDIVASVVGTGKAQAITHGIAVSTAFGSGLCSISQTRAYDGWAFWHRISFRWKAQQLQVKTHSQYRAVNGKSPVIQYGITRLW